MSKPICVIYVPDNYSDITGDRSWIYEWASVLNGQSEDLQGKYKVTDYWKDYYWFVFYKYDITEPEFQVFYEKDFTEIQYQELKELITKSINENT